MSHSPPPAGSASPSLLSKPIYKHSRPTKGRQSPMPSAISSFKAPPISSSLEFVLSRIPNTQSATAAADSDMDSTPNPPTLATAAVDSSMALETTTDPAKQDLIAQAVNTADASALPQETPLLNSILGDNAAVPSKLDSKCIVHIAAAMKQRTKGHSNQRSWNAYLRACLAQVFHDADSQPQDLPRRLELVLQAFIQTLERIRQGHRIRVPNMKKPRQGARKSAARQVPGHRGAALPSKTRAGKGKRPKANDGEVDGQAKAEQQARRLDRKKMKAALNAREREVQAAAFDITPGLSGLTLRPPMELPVRPGPPSQPKRKRINKTINALADRLCKMPLGDDS